MDQEKLESYPNYSKGGLGNPDYLMSHTRYYKTDVELRDLFTELYNKDRNISKDDIQTVQQYYKNLCYIKQMAMRHDTEWFLEHCQLIGLINKILEDSLASTTLASSVASTN